MTAVEYAQQIADELYPERNIKVVDVKYDQERGAVITMDGGLEAVATGLWAFEIKRLLREGHD